MNIKISCGKGSENLNSFEKGSVESLINEYSNKIQRFLKDIISFKVHLKCFQKEGNVKRYYVNVLIVIPKHNFDVSCEGWILHDVVKDAMERVLNEIEGKCHASDSHGVGRRGKC